jgi:hypothetical protein
VRAEVEDGCGNRDNCNYKLTVRDCKKPTPYCYADIVTVVMNNQSETVSIWARDFNLGSFDNCPGVLRYSFSSSVQDTGRVFGCDDLGLNELQMYVTDAHGNQDFCLVQVEIQANGTVCDGSNKLSGKITTEDNKTVKNVSLKLNKENNSESKSTVSLNDGLYNFYNLAENKQYELRPEYDGDLLNGVSTLDLVLIQRHILGVSKLNSPYKVIAADVNNSSTVSAADLVALRKAILGIETKFVNNKSWRFVDQAHQFTNPQKPWPFEEKMSFTYVPSERSYDFKGIKVGDVNNSLILELNHQTTQPRSENALALVSKTYLNQSGIQKVKIYAGKSYDLFGLQTTLEFNSSEYELIDIESGILKIGKEHFGVTKTSDGIVPISFNAENNIKMNEGDELFTILLKPLITQNQAALIQFTNRVLSSEAYDENLSTQKINLENRSGGQEQFALKVSQNRPNPFALSTVIEFDLTKDSPVVIKIYDVNGKVVYNHSGQFNAGKNEIAIKSTDLKASGIYMYSVETQSEKVMKKMVLID